MKYVSNAIEGFKKAANYAKESGDLYAAPFTLVVAVAVSALSDPVIGGTSGALYHAWARKLTKPSGPEI